MPNCVVPGCKNSTNYLRWKEGVSFHRFPKKFQKQWLEAIGKDIDTIISNECICSEHFKTEDFEQYGERRKLKPNVIPTVKVAVVEAISAINPLQNITNTQILQPVLSSSSSSQEDNLEEPSTSRKRKRKLSPQANQPLQKSSSSSSSGSSSVKRRLIQTFHSYSSKSTPELDRQKLRICQQELRHIKRTSLRRKQKISSLKGLLNHLRIRYEFSIQAMTSLENSVNGVPLMLIQRMCQNQKGKITRKKFPVELRRFAMTLQFYNSKAYEYVRATFNMALPAPATISSWFSKIDCQPGYSTPSISSLKIRADKYYEENGKKLLCSLIIDEMSLKKELVCDKNTQQLWGYTDYGCDDIELHNEQELAREALVLMVVGVNDHFKLPFGYFFINKISGVEKANIVKEALRQLATCVNCKILSLTCDGPQVNFKMMNELGCSITDPNEMKNYFLHPITNERLYIIFDICHMLKLVRNNWANSKIFIDPEGNQVKWQYIELLHKIQNDEGLYLGNKIRDRHIDWKKAVMKVNIAAQTLSSSVADALEFLDEILHIEHFKGVKPTVHFLRTMDSLFDLLNSRNPFGRGFKTPLRQENVQYWRPFLENSLNYLENCKTVDMVPIYKTQKRVPFIGFITSGRSLIDIYLNEVERNANLKYILTYKFSQDHLELFFCSIRSRNGWVNNPNCKQFMHTYRRLLLHQDIRSKTGNCIPQDQTNVLTITKNASSANKYLSLTDVTHDRKKESDVQTVKEKIDLFMPTNLNEFADNVVTYIAGFVTKKMEKMLKCEVCAEALTSEDDTSINHQLLRIKNRGKLKIPCKSVIDICILIEKKIQIIVKLSGDLLPQKTDFINTLLLCSSDCLKNPNVFSNLTDHFAFDNALEDISHKKILINNVIKLYGNIRLNSIVKKINEKISGEKLRKTLNRLIIFKHQ